MAKRPYKRLTGRSNHFLSSSALWEGEDHLLLVHSHWVTESYRRFFYQDIQAIIFCPTKTGFRLTLGLILLGVGIGVPAFFLPSIAAGMLGSLAVLCLFLAVGNHLRGPTCRCTLRTAVQTQDLPSLNRVRAVRRMLARVQPAITAAQQEQVSP